MIHLLVSVETIEGVAYVSFFYYYKKAEFKIHLKKVGGNIVLNVLGTTKWT